MSTRKPPSHIVVLKDPAHDLPQLLHDSGIRSMKGHRPAHEHGTLQWQQGARGAGTESYHPALGVGSLNLDAKAATRLREHEHVLGVYANQQRTIQARKRAARAIPPPLGADDDDPARRPLPDPDDPSNPNRRPLPNPPGRRRRPLPDPDDELSAEWLDDDDDDEDRRYLPDPDDGGRRYLPDPDNGGRRYLPDLDEAQFFTGGSGPPGGHPQAGSLAAYARGQRDAWEHMLGLLQKGRGRKKRHADSSELAWGLAAIGLTPHYPLTGKAVKVAVLDTGIDDEHPDFAGQLQGSQLMNLLEPGTKPADRHGHGTHCCGILAGREPAGVPRYAVAPGCTLLVGKVLDDKGGGHDSDILRGIAWAAEAGADIICLCLGSPRGRDQGSSFYQAVAERLAPKECLLVAAAGNGSQRKSGLVAPIYHPAATPSIVAAAAMNRAGRIADFSCGQLPSHEGMVNFIAPGVAILSSKAGGGHEHRSGTSMSVPFVAGVAALILSQTPGLRPHLVWQALERLALPMGRSVDAGRGCVQVPGVPRHY